MVIKTTKTSTTSTDTWEEQFPTATYPLRYKDPQITLQIDTGSIYRTDTSYDGEVWLLAVNRVSTKSTKDNSEARVKFTLTLRDVCWDLPITPAKPILTENTQILWDKWNLSTDSAQISDAALSWIDRKIYCGAVLPSTLGGGFTLSMQYVATSYGSTPAQTANMN